ncbi:uncharacterized protein PV09_01237 [Verruconis gallopava]|uniref:Uncharacterized protein n=1 Tax=Verruconis gallopava TaxID=253628 RepID=A0A0D2ANL5_9PEZI|nr:uncharacterized protein PV09_01237 [Verruconis gallopava]KIW08318.1 hypothetical protein PV09_01237 [Verruconis gallopava]
MENVGTGIKDILPIPHTTQPVADPNKEELHTDSQDTPTLSHSLAAAAVNNPEAVTEEKGAAQREHDVEVVDLGWNEPPSAIANPLIGGMKNEDLWLLVRRFNKQMYHLKEIPNPAPGGLDLNVAEEEEFSPDKLRNNVERLYMTVILGLMAFGKQMARLRSWREMHRTACFATVYFLVWAVDLLVPAFLFLIMTLILSPAARRLLFPPAPIALVNGKTGGVQKPRAGVLGSTDSATGAPENYKGEAVEQEASNFVTGIASVALSGATGKHPQNDPPPDEDASQDAVPDPSAVALSAANAKQKASGNNPSASMDKTKVPMETAMWTKMRPIMHGLANVADTWERVGNALNPTPPFPKYVYRLRLASLVLPLFLISLSTSAYIVVKGTTFAIGFGFFGDPIITPALQWLDRTYPNWQKLLEVRNTILKGVPTNAQLTITLLRIGEANKAPLPPPPRAICAPPKKSVPVNLTDEKLPASVDPPLNATKEELDAALSHEPKVAHDTGSKDTNTAMHQKHGKKGGKILGFLKGTARGVVNTAITTDSLKAKAGSTHAKQRLGVVAAANAVATSGPVEFKCRYNGHKGHAYITTKATIPCIAFSTDTTIEKIGTQDREDLHPAWSIPVQDIKELQKRGGYGWKAKLIVGWALEREVQDGLTIIDRKGNKWELTAMPLRDELFNRLSAMGSQKWESW